MSIDRRSFIATGAASVLAPVAARAQGSPANRLATDLGEVVIHPINHATIVLETPIGVIYVDPVGTIDRYGGAPPPDLILITHEHGDHYNADLVTALSANGPAIVTNPAIHAMLPGGLAGAAVPLANGESGEAMGASIEAVPAYNITEGRLNFHPQGRDNGYVLGLGGRRLYISGDTEGTPEMRGLQGIDLAFVCMNLPFTMAAEQAASAVADFAPGIVYPYHYRGRDDGTQDPEVFADLLAASGAQTEVRFGSWYG